MLFHTVIYFVTFVCTRYAFTFLKKRVSYYLIQSLFFLLAYTSNAQSYNSLSTEQKLELRLESHLLINPKSIGTTALNSLFKSKTPIAVEYITDSDLSFIETVLNQKRDVVIVSDKNIDKLLQNNPSIIQLRTADIETINLQGLKITDSTVIRFNGLEALGRINNINKESITDSLLFKIWNWSGKLPHFISADSSTLKKAQGFVKMFNDAQKIFGVVKTEDKLLQNVSFKNFPNRKANGHFSFTMARQGGRLPVLIPHKAGYYFSPDIIFTSPENSNNQKAFVGFPLDPVFGLSDHFNFEKAVQNRIRNNEGEIISNGVQIRRDSIRKTVGYFNNRAYIDTGLESRTALKSSFTITAWIKPTALGFANSILGKGYNFVLKIHEGYLTFTMAGVKDYISESSPIPINEWTHVALVHSETNNDLKFYLNGIQTDRVELIADYVTSDYNLLIGSDLWEEFFIGYLDDIKIWERELNNVEIKTEYLDLNTETLSINSYIIIGFTLVLLCGIILYFKWRASKSTPKLNAERQTFPNIKTVKTIDLASANYKEKIFCFGSLQIINAEGLDIASKLSPKLKQLFLVVFLHSNAEKRGVTTKKLTELLWPGMSAQSAKNNRGTNIQNLRAILSSCSEINLVFQNKLWTIEIGEHCYCDYHFTNNYLLLFSKENYATDLLETELAKPLSLLKRGRLLTNSNASWLDPYIEKFSNEIIEHCFKCIQILSIEKHGDLLLDLIEVIYLYDDLNEKAMRLKLQILIKQGKLSLAHTVYDNFVKLYQKLYKEDYTISFEASLSE